MKPKPGDYFRRVWNGIAVYGYAMTLKEISDLEQRLGADPEELAYTMRIMGEQIDKGFVWGQAYSVVCPEGEYGLTPSRAATRITKEEFENAKSAEWTD